MRSTLLALALSTAALLACGGAQPPATPPTGTDVPAAEAGAPVTTPTSGGDAGAAPTASAKPAPTTPAAGGEQMFDTLSKDQKVEVMMTKVVPTVGKAFKEHDGKRFAKFGCANCHGKKHDDPQNVLPKLTFSNGGREKLAKTKPEMMKFMEEKVVPTMAAALGEKPFDPTTKQGFSCQGCHTIN